jgi:hypothetical protein
MLRRLAGKEREALRLEFLRVAGEKFDRMFDPEHQPGLRTFKQREDRAVEGGDALSRLMLEAHVQHDELAQPLEIHDCSQCGRPTTGVEEEHPPDRELVTRRGAVHFARSERTCVVCRRALFPPRP